MEQLICGFWHVWIFVKIAGLWFVRWFAYAQPWRGDFGGSSLALWMDSGNERKGKMV